MPSSMTKPPPRSHLWVLALFVGGTFAYLLLVLIGPLLFGVWALVLAAGIAGVGVLLARRHVRRRGRRLHIDSRWDGNNPTERPTRPSRKKSP